MSATDRAFNPSIQAFDVNGVPASGAKLFTYLTGTVVNATTYSDSALSIAAANPIVANSHGIIPEFYYDPELTYKLVLKSADEATTFWTRDPIVTQSASKGIFTPVFIDSGGTLTLTYGQVVGVYWKVGTRVSFGGRIEVGTISVAGTGNLTIGGLPFTADGVSVAGNFPPGLINFRYTGITPTAANFTNLILEVQSGGTTITLRQQTTTTDVSLLPASAISNTTEILFSGTYEAVA
jgi:hypothetical protein